MTVLLTVLAMTLAGGDAANGRQTADSERPRGGDPPITTSRTAPAVGPPFTSRTIYRFDFDEREAGNLEEVPKYWEPIRRPGFPHYAFGTFDFAVGRAAPPSFYLKSEGRSVAYQYTGPETRVRSDLDYRIDGYIRANRLVYARACLSACFMDKAGRPIPSTLVRSAYLGGSGNDSGWLRVELHLGAAGPEAHTIGVAAWVLQEPIWRASTSAGTYIQRNDVHGGAWFDDITIFALPRVTLSTGTPGNILTSTASPELQVALGDDDIPLEARISITSTDGKVVETHSSAVVPGPSRGAWRVPVDRLPPGLYHARLDVLAGETPIASRTLAFARLADRYRNSETLAQPFGVVVDPRQRSDAATELTLLREEAVRSAKLPVWGDPPEAPGTVGKHHDTDRLLQELVSRGFTLTGVFAGPPGTLGHTAAGHARSLVDLLVGDPGVWREHLAAVVAPHASTFRWWQLGTDAGTEDPSNGNMEDLLAATQKLHAEMRAFLTMPLLSLPISTALEPSPQRLPAEQISLRLGPDVQPDWFASLIDPLAGAGYRYVSAYVEPLPADKYARLPRLADFGSRILAARHAGADTVYVPQTWSTRQTAQGQITEPLEEYLVLRTIADVVSDAIPGQRVAVAEGVECLAFHDGESTVLAMWDPHAPRGGSQYPLQLGQADRQINLWGAATPLERDAHGRQILVLSPMPVLVPGVDRWLVELATGVALRPQHVESGTELVQHTVEIAYNGNRPLAGSLLLEGLESWSISPRHVNFSVMPHSQWSQAIEVRYPHNEPAGKKRIVAKITLVGESHYLELPLPVEIGLTDVAVWGLAFVQGNDVVMRHAVTNQSAEVLSFRGSATAPGYERQYRPFLDLQPGQTQSVEYRFRDAVTLIGRKVHVGLREMNDGPRIHNLELVIP